MAASSSTATPASNSTSANHVYDVFINHRGPDVKKTFASHLYHRLTSFGLKVFLDQQELQRGDHINPQIEGAIQTASVHVAIFSQGYAESTWCLNELLLILESKAPIIPVFYQVKPTELRWTQGNDGLYTQQLQRLEKKMNYDPQTQQEKLRHDSCTIEQWRNALSTVAGISGFELEACNGDEGELLRNVVESVLKRVKKTQLNVAKHPTGLDEKVEDFENKVLLQDQQSGRNAQVVGIVGLGGSGKTTLAKEILNRKSSRYSRVCFLSDVRENTGKGSLVLLQCKLLKRLTGSDLQIDNKDEGIQKLKYHLSTSPTLLIIDDVDSVDQIDAIVPNQTCIHSESLILITSRNKGVLTNWGVEKSAIYKLNGLNEQHSVELFSWHAFNQPYPLPEFDSLVNKFIKSCNGLPLSLKVFGALLRGNNDMSYWYEQLDSLQKTLPSEIQKRLQISYEALNREEKHIFLDIAYFLRGQNRDTAITIWNASGWKGRLGFQSLQNRCLVEVNRDKWKGVNEIHMHDHLRDLGRDIAKDLSPRRLWRWTEEDINDLLWQSSVIKVRGIRMTSNIEYNYDYDVFSDINMGMLQLLDTEGALLDRILRRVKHPNLIWLRWNMCPYSSLPSWIPMKNLRVLQLSGYRLETLFQDDSELPECLEEFWADNCWELKSIGGLAQATKLRVLHIEMCYYELEELPSMETLVSLEELWATNCWKLKSIRGSALATKLRVLHIDWCYELEELPSMETLVSLEELWATSCKKLKSIRGLALETKLRVLSIDECYELEELPSMETLVSLEELWATSCEKLKSIRGLALATKLRVLRIDWCYELEELPSMETLVSLEELWATKCWKLKSIRGLALATKLRVLHVSQCYELEELPSMETLVSLEELWATSCKKLKSIRGLALATKLRVLIIDCCYELEELPSMETLLSLEELWSSYCVKLKSIRGLLHLNKLRKLCVTGCSELEEVEGVEYCTSLEMLDVSRCHKLECQLWQ